jgi:erythromycin esterase-like protein
VPAPSHHTSFAGWLGGHAVPLTHLDPEAPLDDLEPLRDIIGGARVVAIGENSHFIAEFSLMRRRILRFLVERCGFTVLAFEYGFSEGFPLDAWAQGKGTDDARAAEGQGRRSRSSAGRSSLPSGPRGWSRYRPARAGTHWMLSAACAGMAPATSHSAN